MNFSLKTKRLFGLSAVASFLLCSSSLESISQDFFPDDLNSTSDFAIESQSDSSGYKQFINYDQNTSTIVDLNATLIESLTERMGFMKTGSDVNLSKSADLKGYVNAIKLKLPSAGNSIADQIKSKIANGEKLDFKDPSTLTKSKIQSYDTNSTLSRSITTIDDLHTAIRSNISNLKTVECYITRKLVNSYYCPLPSTATNSYFTGGITRDIKEDAKAACGKLCIEDSTCQSSDMGKEKTVIANYSNKIVESNCSIEIPFDTGMLGKYIELDFSVTHDDFNTTDDVNLTNYLNENNFKFFMDAEYYDDSVNNSFVPFSTLKSVNVNAPSLNIKVYLETMRSPKYRIVFYDAFKKDTNNTETSDPKLHITLNRSTLEYVDNKFWFCSATHYVENAAKCQGETKQLMVGTSIKNICVTDANKIREPIYGAYYSESSCKNACKIKMDCEPTYRDIPNELSDIEVGCINTPDNTSCTRDKCIELIREDSMPLVEKSWINDDSIKITVANGVQQPDTIRPRVDIDRGLSANSDSNVTDANNTREMVNLAEMVEISYQNMLALDNFNVSKNVIGEQLSSKIAYSSVKNGTTESVYWKLKPNSFDVDNGVTYYLYTIYEIDTTYLPFYGVFNTANGIQSGQTDSNIRLADKVYVIKTPFGMKMFKRIEADKGKFKTKVCNDVKNESTGILEEVCTYEYTWGPIDAYRKVKNQEFVNGSLVDYDVNSFADYFTSQLFNSDTKWETNLAFNSIEEVANTLGVIFKSQSSRSNGSTFERVYTGEEEMFEKSLFNGLNVYGFYSKEKLTYNQLFNFVNSSNMFYSTQNQMTTEIPHDGQFSNERVKFYISGKPDNMSVNVDFVPTSKEEGKKSFIFMLLYGEDNQ